MADGVSLSEQGIVFWPVGSGDSTTIVVDVPYVLQIDIRQLVASDDEEDPHWPVLDDLIRLLPRVNDRPYLAAFVLTHPDQDHCQGFAELLDRAAIGELWFSPRILSEYDADLCDDAVAFKDEAERRIQAVGQNGRRSGDNIRIIGRAELLDEEPYASLPRDMLTTPGDSITSIDGTELAAVFRAFVHAPFKDDFEDERNDTSIGLQVTLAGQTGACSALLLGDLANATVNRVFDRSDATDLAWDVFLAPHHCSKTVTHTQTSDSEDERDQVLLDRIGEAGRGCRFIVASSDALPAADESGADPPHKKAAVAYSELVEDGHFICTGEYPTPTDPVPVVFRFDDGQCTLEGDAPAADNTLAEVVRSARGADAPPATPQRFG